MVDRAVILVGANGFVGSNILESLVSQKIYCLPLSYSKNYNVDRVLAEKLRGRKLTVVLAQTPPYSQYQTDMVGVFDSMISQLNSAVIEQFSGSVEQVIVLSSIHCYDSQLRGTYDETDLCQNSKSSYAWLKRLEEIFWLHAGADISADIYVLRLGNVVGVPQSSSDGWRNLFIPNICEQAVYNRHINIESKINRYFSFISTEYLITIISMIIQKRISPGTYNVVSDCSTSIFEAVKIIEEILFERYNIEMSANLSLLDSKEHEFHIDSILHRSMGLRDSVTLERMLQNVLEFIEGQIT